MYGLLIRHTLTFHHQNVNKLTKYRQLNMRRGYTVSIEGVYLGITNLNTQNAKWIPLLPEVENDWQPPLVSFSFGNKDQKQQATALMDTGKSQMYIGSTPDLTVPNLTITNVYHRVIPGTRFSFIYSSFTQGLQSYDYNRFDAKGKYVKPAGGDYRQAEFMQSANEQQSEHVKRQGNQGNFMDAFSLAFDAQGGRVGFVPKICRGADQV